MKYFEIVQLINNNYTKESLLINNYLINIYLYEERVYYYNYDNTDLYIEIKKKIFNFDKGAFITDERFIGNFKYFPYYKIITTDNDLIAFIDHNEITLFRI